MAGKAGGTGSEQGNAPPEEAAGSAEYSSPACMLHELDPSFLAPREAPAAQADPAREWEEVRLWRKAKRTALIERRLALPAATRAAGSEAITGALHQILASSPGRLVGFYWPFKGEYDPRPLARALHAGGGRLALPVVVGKARPMIFRAWWPGAPMTHGVWNIPVPAEGEPVTPDLLLVPLVGFDARRFRLGYGGGYYDRTLASMPDRPRTIGIGFELVRIATIHPQPHDVAMDLIVTEARAG
ncbi:5-formyltetrahydrofolate cyclo-ligase [Roseomonas marmotae]|uniref:5-formyltetrahydrofolate cyclo-ligase n=1 Tax=Roseomonas marmotae TaxID=2768161 RepID=A0ABS3KCA1_9PROT|nr:5-formyltetrahydrofolate cyclo-ligase [Roseomonas marmotae]MBO1074540.1 5-formyltetrahydrofolate cyclo-ligase [Roseomonas marmotae]QTI81573.1 5-formyltetrahydrofolate cyclo-ligase [Roseomonas marmotae]